MSRPRTLPVVHLLAALTLVALTQGSLCAQTCFPTPPPDDPCCPPLGTATFTSSTNLAWNGPGALCPQSAVFDVVKGDLGLLHSTQDVSQSVLSCLVDDVPTLTTATDASVPAVGTGYWYLVRVVDPSQSLGGPASTTWNSLAPATIQVTDDDILNLNPPSACFP